MEALTKRSHQEEAEKYLDIHNPSVVALGPPCTSFGPWAHLSQMLHPETWRISREIGERLAQFAAKLCRLQLKAGRHFILENLAGSGTFSLACFRELWGSGQVVSINVPRCALGLVVQGGPIYNNTILPASSVLLLKPFEGVKCTHQRHGGQIGRAAGGVAKAKLAQVWPREMRQRMSTGIQALLRQCIRNGCLHVADSFPLGFAGERPRGRPRKPTSGAVDETFGVAHDCPACVARSHKLHPSHTRHDAPPLLCRCALHEPGKWSCEACRGTRPYHDSAHTLEEGCRFAVGGLEVARRAKKQVGQRAGAGPCRDPAIPASGVADGAPITDDLGLEPDVPAVDDEAAPEEEPFGILKGPGRAVTKEEQGGDLEAPPDQNQEVSQPLDVVDLETEEEDIDGHEYGLSPINVRERRVARARRVLWLKSQHSRGDQADEVAAEDHRTTDVAKGLPVLHRTDEAVTRKALQRLHVEWYHCETERLQSLSKVAGAPSRARGLVPQVVQACQVCRPWKRSPRDLTRKKQKST